MILNFIFIKKVAGFLHVFIGYEPEQRTNQQSKGASQQISYQIKMIKTGHTSRTLDNATLNLKSVPLTTRGRIPRNSTGQAYPVQFYI